MGVFIVTMMFPSLCLNHGLPKKYHGNPPTFCTLSGSQGWASLVACFPTVSNMYLVCHLCSGWGEIVACRRRQAVLHCAVQSVSTHWQCVFSASNWHGSVSRLQGGPQPGIVGLVRDSVISAHAFCTYLDHLLQRKIQERMQRHLTVLRNASSAVHQNKISLWIEKEQCSTRNIQNINASRAVPGE